MKMMKKWLSLLLCGVLLLSTGGLFAACGKRTDDGTTNATDATLYSFCLDRTQTRPLPTTPLTFQQVTEYDYLVYSQEALDHAKKFTADIRKHYGVTAK